MTFSFPDAMGALASAVQEIQAAHDQEASQAAATLLAVQANLATAQAQIVSDQQVINGDSDSLTQASARVAALLAQVADLQQQIPSRDQPAGSVKPDATWTGTRTPHASLKPYSGDVSIGAGDIVQGLVITGRVRQTSPGGILRDCLILGPASPPTSSFGYVECYTQGAANLLVEDVEIAPTVPSIWSTGILGHGVIARRVNVHHTVDGFGVFNVPASRVSSTYEAATTIEAAWVHDHHYVRQALTNADGQTHNDGCQIQGGSNLHLLGVRFDAFASPETRAATGTPLGQVNSGVMINDGNVGSVIDVLAEHCWFDGGQYAINASTKTTDVLPGHRVLIARHCRFGRNSRFGPVTISSHLSADIDATNVFDDDGSPIPVKRNG
jgi:hypothetical protein